MVRAGSGATTVRRAYVVLSEILSDAVKAKRGAKIQAITPHDLRHTCASLAVSAGVNVLALQRMLGHASAKMTLDTYAELFDDDLDAVAVTLHSRYSRESSAPKMCPRGTEDGG
jgi:integrase